ncbi:MAG: RluA family pseudouridine synthase [Anaerovoracaceae bacterium]|jgi:23S rRNA pseudouridine955/2504/2580 synthase
MIKVTVGRNDAGQRFDRFLRKYLKNAPLSVIYRIIRKDAKVNGKRAHRDTGLAEGDEISLYISSEDFSKFTEKKKSDERPPKRTFGIIYEDDNILVVNKPAGLLIHGNAAEKRDTLVNQVTDYLIKKGDYSPRAEKTFSPAAVNRLDRNTSGLVLFGKNSESLRELAAMIRERGCIEKHYLTIVKGVYSGPQVLRGTVTKDENKNRVSVGAAGDSGRPIETGVALAAAGDGVSLLDIDLVTGRTHQIRAHLASAGYPLAGDSKYGDPEFNSLMRRRFGLNGQFLHAYRLTVNKAGDPLKYLTGRTFISKLPKALEKTADALFGTEWEKLYRQ